MNPDKFLSLQQPYQELIALENLLVDASRRLKLATNQGLIGPLKKRSLHLVAGGFSAVLAWHALRNEADATCLHDPTGTMASDVLPQTPVRGMEELAALRDAVVILACAPAKAAEESAKIHDLLHPDVTKILLFAPDDEQNELVSDPDRGWLRCNMDYRCVHMAVNMARRYRPLPTNGRTKLASAAILGEGLAALLARMGLAMADVPFAGYASSRDRLPDVDLLVTYAPETFTDRESDLCNDMDYSSAQFLFRNGDKEIPAKSHKGFTALRLLGGGEEGLVFQASAPDGDPCCLKLFYDPENLGSTLDWAAAFADGPPCLSWLAEVKELSQAEDETGIRYPWTPLAHIPFMDEGTDGVLRASVPYCLEFQEAHVRKGFAPSTMPGGIHLMCDEAGLLRFVDVGNPPPSLDEVAPSGLKGYVVKGLAGLTHETLFSGQGWAHLEKPEAQETLRRRLQEVPDQLPGWYADLLRKVLNTPPQAFADPSFYSALRDQYALGEPVLDPELTARAHDPSSAPAPGPTLEVDGSTWYCECLYQSFLYKKGAVESFAATGEKFNLIRDPFMKAVTDSSYLDIGSNNGFFVATAALASKKKCLGIEKKAIWRLQSERIFRAMGLDNAHAEHCLVTKGVPLPKADVVSAFALIHHLYLMDGSFPRIQDLVDHFAEATGHSLFIEYVFNPGYRERAEKRHGRDFNDYTEAGLVDALKNRFPTVQQLARVSDTRTIYLATVKAG